MYELVRLDAMLLTLYGTASATAARHSSLLLFSSARQLPLLSDGTGALP